MIENYMYLTGKDGPDDLPEPPLEVCEVRNFHICGRYSVSIPVVIDQEGDICQPLVWDDRAGKLEEEATSIFDAVSKAYHFANVEVKNSEVRNKATEIWQFYCEWMDEHEDEETSKRSELDEWSEQNGVEWRDSYDRLSIYA